METELLTKKVIGCAIEVHKTLGPGVLESSQESCLLYELQQAGINAKHQVLLPIKYKSILIDTGYRLDILIENNYFKFTNNKKMIYIFDIISLNVI